RKIAYQSGRDRIAGHEDDGDVARCILCRMCGGSLHRDDQVRPAANELGGQLGQADFLALRRLHLDPDSPALEVARVAERRAEWPHGLRAGDEQETDAAVATRLLRGRRARPGRARRDRAAESQDEIPPSHSITSSARCCTSRGTSMPMAFADL